MRHSTQTNQEQRLMQALRSPSIWSGKMPAWLSKIDADILNVDQFPPEDPAVFSLRYIEMAKQWSKNPVPMSEAEIAEFREDALVHLKILAERDSDLDFGEAAAGFERIWPQLSDMLKEPAFYAWLKTYAMDSAFIYTYFVELSGRSPALEIAGGWSWDLTGRYRSIPACDGAYYFRVAEPTFRSFTQRVWFSQQCMLRKAMELGWRSDLSEADDKPDRVKVLFLGGGLLPQIRLYELNPEQVSGMFDITVYDRDPDAMRLWHNIYGKAPDELGIKYYMQDFHDAFSAEELGTYDVVLATGVMSYYRGEDQTATIMSGVRSLLKQGGCFVCDRQVLEPSMLRCVLVLRWRNTGMEPNVSPEEAVSEIKVAMEAANLALDKIEYDCYNDLPAIVLFSAKKT